MLHGQHCVTGHRCTNLKSSLNEAGARLLPTACSKRAEKVSRSLTLVLYMSIGYAELVPIYEFHWLDNCEDLQQIMLKMHGFLSVLDILASPPSAMVPRRAST